MGKTNKKKIHNDYDNTYFDLSKLNFENIDEDFVWLK